MIASSRLPTIRREVSDRAQAELAAAGLNADLFFRRHESGDWGDVPDWLKGDNDRAAGNPRSYQPIRSIYRLDGGPSLMVVTSPDRSTMRLMLEEEFGTRHVSVLEGYAHWAPVYDGDNPLITVEEPVFNAILDSLPEISSALDVGAGTGRVSCKVAQRFPAAQVLGVDMTPEMLAVARARAEREGLSNLRFEQVVLGERPLPAEDNSVDLLTSALMLCHLPDLRAAVAEFVRVVRPGGRLILSDFHPEVRHFGWHPDFVTMDARLLLPYTHSGRQDYLAALTEAGCDILEVHDIGLNGLPYGDVTEEAMKAKGQPPLCLVISAVKRSRQ